MAEISTTPDTPFPSQHQLFCVWQVWVLEEDVETKSVFIQIVFRDPEPPRLVSFMHPSGLGPIAEDSLCIRQLESVVVKSHRPAQVPSHSGVGLPEGSDQGFASYPTIPDEIMFSLRFLLIGFSRLFIT